MIATLRNRWLSPVVFLLLCGAPLSAGAQQFVCWPIVRGDTASGLALRLTGAAVTAYDKTFQIKDPARQQFVPKSHYSRLSTEWQACVARDETTSNLRVPAPAALTAAAEMPAAPRYDGGLVLRLGVVVSLILLMIAAVSIYAGSRPIPPAVQRAGEEFITAFATPLVDPTSAVPPIAARLRFIRRKERLEICIAPHGGRRYPNLADHRKNVEYDVNRVIRILGADRVMCDRLHAEGAWVIVSLRLAQPQQAGAQ